MSHYPEGYSPFIPVQDHSRYTIPLGDVTGLSFQIAQQGLDFEYQLLIRYWSSHCQNCALKERYTLSPPLRVSHWDHESAEYQLEH